VDLLEKIFAPSGNQTLENQETSPLCLQLRISAPVCVFRCGTVTRRTATQVAEENGWQQYAGGTMAKKRSSPRRWRQPS
jgi:hypothetical protein